MSTLASSFTASGVGMTYLRKLRGRDEHWHRMRKLSEKSGVEESVGFALNEMNFNAGHTEGECRGVLHLETIKNI